MISYDMRAPAFGAPARELYAAALDQVAWADALGFDSVGLGEHHGSPDGYNPSPLVLAAAMGSRTQRIRFRTAVVLAPLYDPIKLVEEMIVLDHLSRGRVSYIFGIGYRPAEYELFGLPYEERGRLADEKLAVVLDALKAASDPNGPSTRITPQPFTPGGPTISWGGATKVAARRAGKRTLPIVTPTPTISETTTAGGRSTNDDDGNPAPLALKMAMIPLATPKPAMMPSTVAVTEISSASNTIRRRTCFVLAPIPRNRASSRRRWPIVMPNTLLMMNAATKAVMKAKINNPVPKIEMIWLIESDASSLTCSPVTTSVRAGSTCCTAAFTVSRSAPCSIRMSIVSH